MTSTARSRKPAGITEGGQFTTGARRESGVTLPAPSSPDLYGGFRLTEVSEWIGPAGRAYRATLSENGQPVAHLEQPGHGEATTVRFISQDGAAQDRFTEQAAALAARVITLTGSNAARTSPERGSRLAGELLLARLLAVAAMDRRLKPAFIFDGDDFWGQSQYREMGSQATLEDLARYLSTPEVAAQHPRVWDSAVGDFVPYAQWSGRPD
ncbi:hypothetical protein [Pseudactinotalea terrae]|uniref:hypothetical protein n=1 Tax=Pseudactinotalea terrae TaxID=1743262 RepID=UPI0012E0E823|nr:hypothetical protein [Pseudactinotalea terrae]